MKLEVDRQFEQLAQADSVEDMQVQITLTVTGVDLMGIPFLPQDILGAPTTTIADKLGQLSMLARLIEENAHARRVIDGLEETSG